MLKIGLDIGTGFVKCVSDYGSIRFPSLYAKRTHGNWTNKVTEAVGNDALQMLHTMGTSAVRPIIKGKPDPRYSKQVELLIQESIRLTYKNVGRQVNTDEKISMVVGLPYHAFDNRDHIVRLIKKTHDIEKCAVVAQAAGTLADLRRSSGIVVSIGQGTTEMIVIDNFEVIDGESSSWASDFVTKKIGKFAHLDVAKLSKQQDTCRKYTKTLADNLAREICEISENYNNRYDIALSGGGLLLPGVKEDMCSKLEKFKLLIPDDPVMSNARGLYKFAR